MIRSKNLHKAINLLENRLNIPPPGEDTLFYEKEIFPEYHQCMYLFLLGDSYFKIYKNTSSEKAGILTLENLKKALLLVNNPSADIKISLKLLVTYKYCEAVSEIRKNFSLAKIIAEKTFELNSSITSELQEKDFDVLQKLRDHFMSLIIESIDQPSKQEGGENKGELSLEDIEKIFSKENQQPKQKSIKFSRKESFDTLNNPNLTIKQRKAISLKKLICISSPIYLDGFASSQNIARACEKIFRAYVRGNALSGQLAGGNVVEMSGYNMPFRTFAIQGPYMSWRGFLTFLLDFSIVEIPSKKTSVGKKFLTSIATPAMKDIYERVSDNNVTSVDPLVGLLEAAIIFLESSLSSNPLLIQHKHKEVFEELSSYFEKDSWTTVFEWAENTGVNEWNLDTGLNLVQFIDSLGKLAIMSYSNDYFNEMLPSKIEKIEHFLSAYLGLTDDRRWLGKIEKKIKKSQSALLATSKMK